MEFQLEPEVEESSLSPHALSYGRPDIGDEPAELAQLRSHFPDSESRRKRWERFVLFKC